MVVNQAGLAFWTFHVGLTILTNCVMLKQNDTNRAFASWGKIDTASFEFNELMATTAHHNEHMIDLGKKCTILFLCGVGCCSCMQFSYALMQI